MLSKPTPNQLRSLHALQAHPGWAGIESLLDDELKVIQARLMDVADLDTLRQLQGRAQAIRDFQKVAANAADILEKQGHRGL